MSEEVEESAKAEKKPGNGMMGKLLLLIAFLGAQVGVGLFVAKSISPAHEDVATGHEEHKSDKKEHAPKAGEGEEGAEEEEGVKPHSLEKGLDLTGMVAGAADHYWVIQVNFEWDGAKYPKFKEMVEKEKKALIMDAINQIASAKQMPDWQAPDAMQNLRKAIIQDLNAKLPKEEGQLRKVFITKFLIQ